MGKEEKEGKDEGKDTVVDSRGDIYDTVKEARDNEDQAPTK